MQYSSSSRKQTYEKGREFSLSLKGRDVVCCYGELGAGKTTFIQGVISHFLPHKRVLSPTFIIVRHYRIPSIRIKNMYHIDLYRMENEKQIQEIGLTQLFGSPNTVVFIEWAEKLGKLLPKKRYDLVFKEKDETIRSIDIKKI